MKKISIEDIEEEVGEIVLPKRVNKFTHFMAMFISYLFHPVFMPTILLLAIYKFVPATFAGIDQQAFTLKYILPTFMCTAFFPILSVLLLKGLDFIENIHLYNPRDRIIPLIIAMIFYFTLYYFFKGMDAPFLVRLLLLGSYLNITALFLINIFFKVSMHTTGAGAMLGMVIILLITSPISMTLPLFLALLVAGIIGTARLLLGAHRSSEIWLGYVIGILVQLGAYWYLS